MEQLIPKKLSMRNLSKYFLSIVIISLGSFLIAYENVYEYKIRFKIKNVISLDGIKELSKKENDAYHIIFNGKNSMLNAELNQEAEFKYLNAKIFPQYYSQRIIDILSPHFDNYKIYHEQALIIQNKWKDFKENNFLLVPK